MKLKYKRYSPDILRPVIPIQLLYDNQGVWYEALVDSGADENVFDAQIGELLGIDIKTGTKSSVIGITGVERLAYHHKLQMKVGSWLFTVTAAFVYDIAPLGYSVVGQQGFFDFFIVKFDLLKEAIELTKRR